MFVWCHCVEDTWRHRHITLHSSYRLFLGRILELSRSCRGLLRIDFVLRSFAVDEKRRLLPPTVRPPIPKPSNHINPDRSLIHDVSRTSRIKSSHHMDEVTDMVQIALIKAPCLPFTTQRRVIS